MRGRFRFQKDKNIFLKAFLTKACFELWNAVDHYFIHEQTLSSELIFWLLAIQYLVFSWGVRQIVGQKFSSFLQVQTMFQPNNTIVTRKFQNVWESLAPRYCIDVTLAGLWRFNKVCLYWLLDPFDQHKITIMSYTGKISI